MPGDIQQGNFQIAGFKILVEVAQAGKKRCNTH